MSKEEISDSRWREQQRLKLYSLIPFGDEGRRVLWSGKWKGEEEGKEPPYSSGTTSDLVGLAGGKGRQRLE